MYGLGEIKQKSFAKQQHNNGRIFYIVLLIMLVAGTAFWLTHVWHFAGNRANSILRNKMKFVMSKFNGHEATEYGAHLWNQNCSYWDCFNVYRCGQQDQGRIKIYVYPFAEYVNATGEKSLILTKEYYRILEAVIKSDYYTRNPNEACIFLPSMDMLNERFISRNFLGKALVSLDYWDNGENHLIFNIFPGNAPQFNRILNVNTEKAIFIGSGFDSLNYRTGFDIVFPVWSPLLANSDIANRRRSHKTRKYFLISAQPNLLPIQSRLLQKWTQDYPAEVLLLQSCKKRLDGFNKSVEKEIVRCEMTAEGKQTFHKYPDILSNGIFCLFASTTTQEGRTDFLEIMAHNCIPVVADKLLLPFEDVIDWSLATISINEISLPHLLEKLRSVSQYKIVEMQQQCQWLFEKYFKDLHTITLTTLEILNDRVFPHLAKTRAQWNRIDTNYKSAQNPLFQPIVAVSSQGFTAVILTYDRVESLFTLISRLATVSSLQCVLVIWNNQRKSPPPLSLFPKIMKPIKVIQTQSNKLSNRFYPYDEIETEAILTIDDDILMLTADELNFGFEVWREFPDRIVGFPSRIHVWDNITMRWHYESEWTNQISMVLTGAAFHHKYWNYMYTNVMPIEIRDWVDSHMNCEDIAMNFLVANITNNPPIKVTPRKKFKCPECINTEMLSAYLNHMIERSTCIDHFADFYGHMPLKSVEFRADPVLYKDNFPDKLKRYNEIGSL